jgi:hypothetical protein
MALAMIQERMVKQIPQTEGLKVEFASGGWFGMTISGDAPDIGMLSSNVHFAQAVPLAWGTYHGKILADYLATGASQDYVFMKGIDRPVALGGKALSRTFQIATGLLAGIKGLRHRT